MLLQNLKSVALPVPEIRGVAKLQTPNLEEGEAIGGRGWYHSKERAALVSSYKPSIHIIPLSAVVCPKF